MLFQRWPERRNSGWNCDPWSQLLKSIAPSVVVRILSNVGGMVLCCLIYKSFFCQDWESIVICFWWHLWLERNRRIFQREDRSISILATLIEEELSNWIAVGVIRISE